MSDTQSDPEPLDAEFELADDSPDRASRQGSGLGISLAVFLFASLAGGALGFAAVSAFPPTHQADDAGAADERAALVQHMTGLETRLGALESEALDPATIAEIGDGMIGMDNRIAALEASGSSDASAAGALGALEARLDAIEVTVSQAQAGADLPSVDLAPLEARLTQIETAQNELTTQLLALAEVERAGFDPDMLLAINDRLGALESGLAAEPEDRSPAEIESLTARIAALETALTDAQDMAAGAQAAANEAQSRATDAEETASASIAAAQSDSDRQLAARALALTALHDMAGSGAAFEAERAALARQWRGNSDLAGLANFSRAGVLTPRELADSYPGDEIRDADGGSTHFWGLIALERVDPEMDETGTLALTALSEQRLAADELAAAISVTEQLEGEALEAAREWLVQARARTRVDEHIAALRADLTRAAAAQGEDPS